MSKKYYRAVYSYTTNFAHFIEADSQTEAERKADSQDGPLIDEYTNGSKLVELIPLSQEEGELISKALLEERKDT
jgi:hypothetical protein